MSGSSVSLSRFMPKIDELREEVQALPQVVQRPVVNQRQVVQQEIDRVENHMDRALERLMELFRPSTYSSSGGYNLPVVEQPDHKKTFKEADDLFRLMEKIQEEMDSHVESREISVQNEKDNEALIKSRGIVVEGEIKSRKDFKVTEFLESVAQMQKNKLLDYSSQSSSVLLLEYLSLSQYKFKV